MKQSDQTNARARHARVSEVNMTRARQIPCPECSKKFKTSSGLRWHLYHRHGWQDIQALLAEPASAKLAKAAMFREIELEVFAKAVGKDVGYVKQLIQKHFGKDSE